MKKLMTALLLAPILLLPRVVSAHCPLCTIGAGAAALGASYLGVHNAVVGVFIGAFAMALGLWMARVVKKKFIPFQKSVIVTLSFASVIIPLLPMMKTYSSYYLSLFGGYGTLFNRTYVFNLFLIGSLLGALIVMSAPIISKTLTEFRQGRIFPFQGVSITLTLLILVGVLVQIVVM